MSKIKTIEDMQREIATLNADLVRAQTHEKTATTAHRKAVIELAKAKASEVASESGEPRGSRAYQAIYNETFERVRQDQNAAREGGHLADDHMTKVTK